MPRWKILEQLLAVLGRVNKSIFQVQSNMPNYALPFVFNFLSQFLSVLFSSHFQDYTEQSLQGRIIYGIQYEGSCFLGHVKRLNR
jgi:hypothetical protein